jgi:hypothetical protein
MDYIGKYYKNKCDQLYNKISLLENTISSYKGTSSPTPMVAGVGPRPATEVAFPFTLAGVNDPRPINPPNIPAPPSGAPAGWVNRWNYIFTNWNNWQPNTNIFGQYFSNPGAALGWLLSQWGNPGFGTWS